MWVNDSDYTNYAVIWVCKNNRTQIFSTQYAWILARRKDSISDAMMKDIFSRLQNNKIKSRYFKFTRQSFCGVRAKYEKEEPLDSLKDKWLNKFGNVIE